MAEMRLIHPKRAVRGPSRVPDAKRAPRKGGGFQKKAILSPAPAQHAVSPNAKPNPNATQRLTTSPPALLTARPKREPPHAVAALRRRDVR